MLTTNMTERLIGKATVISKGSGQGPVRHLPDTYVPTERVVVKRGETTIITYEYDESTLSQINQIENGEIVVSPNLTVHLLAHIIDKASAIIVEEIALTSHAVTIAREQGIPVVATNDLEFLEFLPDGARVRIDEDSGDILAIDW